MPEHYRAVVEHDGVVRMVVNGRQTSIPRRAFVTAWMRQIAHEIQRTLERDFGTQAILEGRPSGLTLEGPSVN